MALLTADINAVARAATVFITYVQPGWPPFTLNSLDGPSTSSLTDPYPLLTVATPLEIVAAIDTNGDPGPENRMAIQMANRADTLRAALVVLIRTMNLTFDRFLDRDGAQTPAEDGGVMFMRGDLNMGGYKIIGLDAATDAGDLVRVSQLTAVINSYQDNVEQIAASEVILRDGSIPMQNALSMDIVAEAPTHRVINLGVPSATGLAIRKTELDDFRTDFLADYLDLLGTKSMQGALDMRETVVSTPNRINNVGSPSADAHAANRDYVDTLFLGGGGAGIPVGTVLPFMGSVLPTGWHLCDGRDLNRTTYSALFAIIGTTYGTSSGTTFRVPDLRGRVLAANDNLGGSPANRLTDSQADVIGGVLGDQEHQLTPAQMPSHTHQFPDAYMAGGSAGAYVGKTTPDSVSTLLKVGRVTESAGSSQPHNNVQPSLTCVWMIRG